MRDAVAKVMDGVSFGELVRRAEAEGERAGRYYI